MPFLLSLFLARGTHVAQFFCDSIVLPKPDKLEILSPKF